MNVAPKGMENNPKLQTNDDNNQSNGAIDNTDTMQLVRILGDPPKRAPGGRIELEQEGDKEEEK